MSTVLRLLFQFFPPMIAYGFLALFTILLIFLAARLVKIVLDALPFV